MRKILLILILGILFTSCDDDDNEIQSEDLSFFFDSDIPQFSALLDDESLNWEFGFGTYDASYAYWWPSGDPTDPNRYLRFTLNQVYGDNLFSIRTPLYDTSAEDNFNDVFGIGLKTIGDSPDDFFLRLRKNHESYSICDSDAEYQIEILKTEEILDDFPSGPSLYVWIKIVDLNLNDCNPNTDKNLTDGLILAKFRGYKFE